MTESGSRIASCNDSAGVTWQADLAAPMALLTTSRSDATEMLLRLLLSVRGRNGSRGATSPESRITWGTTSFIVKMG
eukprot:CAMPEP_0172874012 /NCGR_PEP_ID=MMETSP1075-20121228/96966_1 /TAXON_ID=2916 /ORGANISM="Ceratium fusus, Strain PA161109" /LENGTH=76 /DNA_ID=CAMNT_0013724699 /DNA_START=101 /DNA_END=327 /DNA_ORIENTATION=-